VEQVLVISCCFFELPMILPLIILFFVFGLVIGSFLNVVIYRYHTEKSILGRSACMSCQDKLVWYDLVPLFSFFLLKGRCKTCKTKISRQYPIVEFLTGVVFALLFFKFQDLFFWNLLMFTMTYVYYAVLFSILIVISVYDWKHKIIPDGLVLLFGVLAFISVFLFSGSIFNLHIPQTLEVFSGVILAAPFALIWLLSKGAWMGLGDAKLELGLGWLLGLSWGLSAVALAFWSGALVGIVLIVFSKVYSKFFPTKHSLKSEIPFAPFLAMGALIAFVLELSLFPIF